MASRPEQKEHTHLTSPAPHKHAGPSRPATNTMGQNAKICRDFTSLGKCRYGEKCRFLHKMAVVPAIEESPVGTDVRTSAEAQHPARVEVIGLHTKNKKVAQASGGVSLGPSRPQSNAPKDPKSPNLNKNLCRLYKAGKCTFGDKCRYSHNDATVSAQVNEKGIRVRTSEQEAARFREVERLEEERKARDAERKRKAAEEAKLAKEAEQEKVRLAAEEAAQREAKKLQAARERAEARAKDEAARKALLAEQDALRIQREAAFTTQHVVLGSSLVTFGAGLEVRSLVSGFESCRLMIRNIPTDAKPQEIADLFTQQGMSRDDVHILSILPANSDHLEAKVLTSSAQGGIIAVGLDGIEFRNETLQFEVGEIISTGSMGASNNSRQANTLSISWFAPSLAMIATYSTIDLAQKKQQTLNKGLIRGRRIKVEMNSPPSGPALRYYNPASVKITGLPMGTEIATVMDVAETPFVRAIKSNSYDLEQLLTDLREHVNSIPDNNMVSVERLPDQEMEGGAMLITVKVRFENWEDADNARASLEGKRLRLNYPTLRLSLPPPLHFTSTIPIQQYEAQKRLWDSLAEPILGKGPRIFVDRVQARGTVNMRIRLSGDDKKLVGALKVRVETLVAGEKLDATYWHRSFLWGKGQEFFANVFSSTKVYVRSDVKSRCLNIFGEGEAKDRARQMIEDEVARLAMQEWTVNLKRQSVGYFVRKGLAALKEILGEDGVTLDLASTPCKLTIRGGEEARHALNNIMDQSLNNFDFDSSDLGDDICPICYDAVSNPVVLGCKHVYCTACIRHYLTSASETKIFPLVCMGDEAQCTKPIAIPVIQRFLIPQQYEHLINIVFSTYIDKHPQDFKYCTTPDCTQIYRANMKSMLKCPSCFAEVCSMCHEEAHEGMTCDDRRARKAQQQEELNDRWATIHNVKKCPSCLVYIEKTEGCNHITCRCGAHICWICVVVFPADQIYGHLGNVHGGAYDGDGERRNADLVHALALQHQIEQADHVREDRLRQAAELRLLRQRQDEERRTAERRLREQREAEARRQNALREWQREFDARQERAARELEERRRKEGRGGCLIM